jgi:hypothetical protein
MPSDPHVVYFDREGRSKDRDAVIVYTLERIVIDYVPLEQYAHGGGVRAEYDVPVESEELGFVELV